MMPASQLTFGYCLMERDRENQEKKTRYGLDRINAKMLLLPNFKNKCRVLEYNKAIGDLCRELQEKLHQEHKTTQKRFEEMVLN